MSGDANPYPAQSAGARRDEVRADPRVAWRDVPSASTREGRSHLSLISEGDLALRPITKARARVAAPAKELVAGIVSRRQLQDFQIVDRALAAAVDPGSR